MSVLTLVVLLSLSACASPAGGLTARQTHARVTGIYDIAARAVGGKWKRLDGGADDCTTADGQRGATWTFSRQGPGVPLDAQPGIVKKIVDAWRRDGYATTKEVLPSYKGIVVTQLEYRATTHDTAAASLRFGIGTHGSDFTAVTRCAPGNAEAINSRS